MKSKEVVNVWQLGLGAGMLFGFGSNAMEFFVPAPSLHLYVKSGLLIISCVLILSGYAQVRKMVSVGHENE